MRRYSESKYYRKANQKQLEILKQGSRIWNKWREKNPDVEINLTEADLNGANLSNANLSEANLFGADLSEANLAGADLSRTELMNANLSYADLSEAYLSEANLYYVNLSYANLDRANLGDAYLAFADLYYAKLRRADLGAVHLINADLSYADLRRASLLGANLLGANLSQANLNGAELINSNLVQVNISNAKISNSRIYGVNVWDLEGDFKEQSDLIITRDKEAKITVDNIKVAQFIYLLLDNKEIRDVINTLTSKTILILGRFSIPERKKILNTLKNKLRRYGLLPIVFDFDRPTDKDFTETIKTLAGLSYFVIADITNPKSSPLELQATVPDYQIPFVPIIQEGESPFAMMVDLQKKYNWVLNTVTYDSADTLMKVLKPLIIDPAMKKRNELRIIKAQVPEVISGKDFLEKGKV